MERDHHQAKDGTAARLLSASAHALRNDVATIRSVVRLVDDAEVASALDDASRSVQVALERAIVLSRVELDEHPVVVSLTLADLLDLAARRARREGAEVEHAGGGEGADAVVELPGTWAERLVADLLHHNAGAPGLTATTSTAVIEVPLLERPAPPLDGALVELARACGGELAWNDGFACLRLPRVRTVSEE